MESTNISVLRDEIEVHHDGERSDERITIPQNVEVYEIDGPFFFGIATRFEELTRMRTPMPIRIVRMRKVSFIDSTGIHNLEIFIEAALGEGQTVILSGVNPQVFSALRRARIVEMVGEENVLDHIDKALARAAELAAKLEQ